MKEFITSLICLHLHSYRSCFLVYLWIAILITIYLASFIKKNEEKFCAVVEEKIFSTFYCVCISHNFYLSKKKAKKWENNWKILLCGHSEEEEARIAQFLYFYETRSHHFYVFVSYEQPFNVVPCLASILIIFVYWCQVTVQFEVTPSWEIKTLTFKNFLSPFSLTSRMSLGWFLCVDCFALYQQQSRVS